MKILSEKITEQIEYLTQIHTAWDGTEQRVVLRGKPRRYVKYEYVGVNTKQSQYLRALTCSTQTQVLQFPLWHANTILENMIYDRQSIVALKKQDMWNYRDCAGTMLWTNDEEGGEYFTLKNVSADGILHLGKQVTHNWKAFSTFVVPVFWGILQQEDKYTNLTAELTNMTINVEFINRGLSIDLPDGVNEYNYPRLSFAESKNALDEYLGRELFMMPPTWNEDIGSSYSRNANRLDNQSGVIRYDLKSNETTEVRSMEYSAISYEELQFIQRFFCRCKGRLKSFYAPTWVIDVELVESVTSGNVLIAKFNLYWKYYMSSKRRKTLIVFFQDGTIEILKIAGFSLDDSQKYGKIFLDMPIKKALHKSEIKMISFLCLYRFNSDTLTTDYETTGIANINLEFAEVTE